MSSFQNQTAATTAVDICSTVNKDSKTQVQPK